MARMYRAIRERKPGARNPDSINNREIVTVIKSQGLDEGTIVAKGEARCKPLKPILMVSSVIGRVCKVCRRFIKARTRERSSVGVNGFVMKSSAPTDTKPLSAATGKLPDATKIIMP